MIWRFPYYRLLESRMFNPLAALVVSDLIRNLSIAVSVSMIQTPDAVALAAPKRRFVTSVHWALTGSETRRIHPSGLSSSRYLVTPEVVAPRAVSSFMTPVAP